MSLNLTFEDWWAKVNEHMRQDVPFASSFTLLCASVVDGDLAESIKCSASGPIG